MYLRNIQNRSYREKCNHSTAKTLCLHKHVFRMSNNLICVCVVVLKSEMQNKSLIKYFLILFSNRIFAIRKENFVEYIAKNIAKMHWISMLSSRYIRYYMLYRIYLMLNMLMNIRCIYIYIYIYITNACFLLS